MAATVLYAFVGIPLLLMVLADLGKLFTRAIKWVFLSVRQLFRTGRCGKHRSKAPPPQVRPSLFGSRLCAERLSFCSCSTWRSCGAK